ncbi:MAG: sulfotransferase [Burkholderiales bacterium]|nr:sulfotransferase [Burkholderiales bacterium]
MRRELLQVHPRLLAWLRSDAGWPALPLTLRARLAWQAAWGGWNSRLGQQALASESPALRDPVFVLGPWRSGSTAMHELLVAATGLPTPLTWQCMNATAFLLGRPPRNEALSARPMDGLPVGALSPQEDEFALLSLGGDSLYRAFWQPQRASELLPLLQAEHWQAHAADWLPLWETFLHGVLHTLKRVDEPLLLKSPNHSLRWVALRQRFPQARAVWMLREAEAVYRSNLKMWRQMATLHGLHAAPAGALEALLAAALQALALALLEAMVAPQPPVLVWQSRLRESPRETLQEVCAQLALPADTEGPAFQAALATVAQGRADRYEPTPLSAEAAAAVAALDSAQAEAWAVFSARR